MKILFVQEVFGNLSEVFLYRMITKIDALDVEVLTGKYINQESYPFDKTKIHIWNKEKLSFTKKIFPLARKIFKSNGSYTEVTNTIISQINNSNADLICFQFSSIPVLFGKDIEKIKKKTCVIHHGSDVNLALEHKTYHRRLKILWNKMDKIFFVSQFLMQTALNLGCPKAKATVVYLGVPVITKNKLPEYKKNDPSVVRFICVARMVPVKNHITLIEAFSEVLKSTCIKVELILIGTGELQQKIQNKIHTLNIDKYIKILGGLSNDKVLYEIAKSDCVILISKKHIIKKKMHQEEGLPISLLEGGSMGIPMIGSNTGGIPEIVHDNITGYLVDPLNIEEIKNAMIKIVKNPLKSKSMGQNARAMIEKDFNLDIQINKFQAMFMSIIDKHY